MTSPRYVLHLAVLPTYRSACIAIVRNELGPKLGLFVSAEHLDRSVKTGISRNEYTQVPMLRLGRFAFVQFGGWVPASRAAVTILDLNPRSLSAWLLITIRRLLRRRTRVWGHMFPQQGPGASTARLRSWMRSLTDGTVSYTYSEAEAMRKQGVRTWTAPNALYAANQIHPSPLPQERTDVLYVGRFSSAKKVDLLVRGFREAVDRDASARLTLVGDGVDGPKLRQLVHSLGLDGIVTFTGWINDIDQLRELYGRAFCSASPGFAGLGLTQSLGFGVPQLVARDEPHSPEIELARDGAVTWFESDSPSSLADAILQRLTTADQLPLTNLSQKIRDQYSAEAMAAGLLDALEDTSSRKDHVDG